MHIITWKIKNNIYLKFLYFNTLSIPLSASIMRTLCILYRYLNEFKKADI